MGSFCHWFNAPDRGNDLQSHKVRAGEAAAAGQEDGSSESIELQHTSVSSNWWRRWFIRCALAFKYAKLCTFGDTSSGMRLSTLIPMALRHFSLKGLFVINLTLWTSDMVLESGWTNGVRPSDDSSLSFDHLCAPRSL